MVSVFSSGASNAFIRLPHADFGGSQASIQHGASREFSENRDNLGDVVVINVAGKRFETYETTLSQFPESLLGDPERRKRFTNPRKREYFFDRHRGAFEAILFYYQSGGVIIRPQNIPIQIFLQECQFFDIGQKQIDSLQIESGLKEPDVQVELPAAIPQRILWEFLDNPDSSKFAKCFAIISLLIIFLSLAMFVMESLKEFSSTYVEVGGVTTYKESKHAQWMSITNTLIISWFTVEFLVRLLVFPNKIKFFVSPLNIIDLLSILPYYISLGISQEDANKLNLLRVIRVLRVFKLSRYFRGLQVLGNTLKASINELLLFVFFLFVVVLIFGSCVYFAENEDKNSKFVSIPKSFWWAVVTMTTVGYGDMYPKTLFGQIIGGFAVICGILTIALPVPVIVSNFQFFYTRERNRKKFKGV